MLSGCVTWEEAKPWFVPVNEAPKGVWELHHGDVLPLVQWVVNGRMALQSGDEGWNAQLTWQQQPNQYSLRFIAPFGQGTWQLQGSDAGVVMTTSENQQVAADSAEVLMLEHLGWNVPLDGLQYWVRGIPNPDQPVANMNVQEDGLLLDLDQQGWRISLLRYVEVNGHQLPAKIFLANDRFQLRLIIKQWELAKG